MSDEDPMGLAAEIGQKVDEKIESSDFKMVKLGDVNPDEEVDWNPEKETAEVARTPNQFQNLIALAKTSGKKEISASKDILNYLLNGRYDEKSGFILYQDVFVYEEGRKEEVKKNLGMTVEQKIFGAGR